MITKLCNELSEKIQAALPPSLQAYRAEFEKTIHSVLKTAFAQLNLVTREEFDLQAELLAQSRKRLAELETRLNDLLKK